MKHYKISLENLAFEAIVGVLPKERESRQKIVLNLELTYEKVVEILDYREIRAVILEAFEGGEFFYLEDALDCVIEALVARFGGILRLDLKIAKPEIFSDCVVSVEKHWEAQ